MNRAPPGFQHAFHGYGPDALRHPPPYPVGPVVPPEPLVEARPSILGFCGVIAPGDTRTFKADCCVYFLGLQLAIPWSVARVVRVHAFRAGNRVLLHNEVSGRVFSDTLLYKKRRPEREFAPVHFEPWIPNTEIALEVENRSKVEVELDATLYGVENIWT